MKVTKRITIRDRVFSISDLKNIAAIFAAQQELANRSKHLSYAKFIFQFSDNTSIESKSTEIVDSAVLDGPGRPYSVRFSFRNSYANWA